MSKAERIKLRIFQWFFPHYNIKLSATNLITNNKENYCEICGKVLKIHSNENK
jgi:hypothetical protein